MWKSIASLCVCLSCALPTYAQTSIAPAGDATGTQVNAIGNQYNITGGTQAGSNLFHSFQQLGLNPGEVANFIARPHIQNILGRVVGGEASLINGLLQVVGGNANLYLMNPAGIIFGPNAQLNVPADFTATTATAIGFGRDTWFNHQGENNYADLIGTPSEFQFPYHNPGVIINEGKLTLNSQQQLTLLGGTVINLGTLEAPGGKITIAAIPGQQVVRISQHGHLLTLDLPLSETPTTEERNIQPSSLPELITGGFLSHASQIKVNQNGQVELTRSNINLPSQSGLNITSGNLNVFAKQGGEIHLLGEQIGVIDANINASGTNGGGRIFIGGDRQGQGILPNAFRTFIDPNSIISADALEAGNGGDIIAFAEESARIYGTLSAKGGQLSGNGGFIETSGLQYLDITQTPDTSAPFGEGGTWLIDPYNVEIVAGAGNIEINSSNPFSATGDTAQLGVDLVRDALKNSSNVEITTGIGGSQQGDITLSTDLDFDDIGNSSLTLNAEGGIFINRPIFDSNLTTPDSLNLNFQGQSRSVTVNAPITTQGGDINMTGESSGNGISLTASLNSGGGEINLTGTSVGSGNGINIEVGIDSGGGDINIEAATTDLVALNVQAPISAGTGNISLISDLPSINNKISGTGNLLIRPQNPNATIFIGPDIPGQFSLNEVEIAQQIESSGTVTIENTGTISIAALDLNNSSNSAPARQYTLVLKGETLEFFNTLTLSPNQTGQFIATGNILDRSPVNSAIFDGNVLLDANAIGTATDPLYIKGSEFAAISRSGDIFLDTGDILIAPPLNTVSTVLGISGIQSAGQLNIQGSQRLNLGANLTSNGDIAIDPPLTLVNDITLESNGESINLNNTIEGTHDLTANSDNITFSAMVGRRMNPLNSLTLNGNTILNGNVMTTGVQTYNGSVQVNNNLTLESENGDITFEQTIEGSQDFTQDLKLDAGTGNITFNGEIGSKNPLANFTLDSTGLTEINDTINTTQVRTNAGGTTRINGDISTTGEQAYNDSVILGSNVTLRTNNSNLTFDNTVNGTTVGTQNLTVQTGTGSLRFFGAVGNSVPLGDITLIADDMSFDGSLAGTGNLTLEPFTESQNIRLGGTDTNDSNTLEISSEDIQNWQDGFQAIAVGRNTLSGTVVTEGSLTFQDPVRILTGASQTINGTLTGNDNASITLNAAQINLNADITTANNDINLNGAVNLGTDALLSTGTGEGNLNLGSTVDGNATLTLEPGTGAVSLNGDIGQMNPLNTLSIQGNASTGTDSLSITTVNDLTTGDISTSGQALNLTSNQGNIQAGNLDTSAPGSGANLSLTSPTGSITTGNLIATGDTAGGDINVQAQVSISTGNIDSSATTGDGGSVFLDPIGNVQVGFINAQGGTAGTGGNVFAESTGAFFQATGTFVDQNGQNASISTAGGLGGGTIEIRHQGGRLNTPIQPFVIGNSGVNGTQGVITTGTFTLSNQEFPDSFRLGTIQVVTDDGTTPITVTPPTIVEPINNPVGEPTIEPSVPPLSPVTPPTFPNPLIPTERPSISEFPTPAPSTSDGDSGNGSGNGNDGGGGSAQIPSTPQFPAIGFEEGSLENSDNGVGNSVNSVLLGRENRGQAIAISADQVSLDQVIAALEAQFTREYEIYLGLEDNTRILQLREIQNGLEEASQEISVKTGLIYVVFSRRQLRENAALVCPVPTAVEAEGVEQSPACRPHAEDTLQLILVTGNDDPIHVDFPGVKREQVMALVNELRQEVTNQFKLRTTSYLSPAQKLHKLLIEPLESTLEEQGIDTLVMIPDAGLRSLPMAVLHDGEDFLIEKYSLGLVPSFSLTLPEYRNLQGAKVLAMGASEFSEMPPLPAVPVELQEIGGEDAFLNQEFTLENLKAEHQTGQFPIVHLATHADFQDGAPDNSFIQLWESQIQLPDMTDLDWGDPRVELLTLSACRTALGSQDAELGFAGLAVMSGAKSALASLWYSSDLGTLALMSKFYDQLESAPTRAEALRRVQLAMLQGEVSLDGGQLRGTRGQGGITLPKDLAQGSVSFSHPYYWAAFTMIGTPW
ncbi:CHAT domain-containing protein [Roseofilum sp. Guam]|uniref:CHAT domain-containing protein n=1 Tax=Roseofilum sp. Guam TaxID=2821502 RepID=UPI001B100ABA|nr:CHAT domain-containing protein [Roseofilum sp. Guam]MBP0029359.1 CHAT domain-containing protein [Roseofilum sp. Guam]